MSGVFETRPVPRFLTVLFLILTCAIGGSAAAQTRPADPLAPPDGIGPDLRAAYETGRLIFNGHWRPSGTDGPDNLEGLGPLYNRISCASCHSAGGRGKPPGGPGENFLTALVRIGVVGEDGSVEPHPLYGQQIQDRAIPGMKPEAELSLTWRYEKGRYPDGTPYELRRPDLTITPDPGPDARWSIRVAQPLHGVGKFAHAVPGPDDTGRFGWKAAMPSLAMQNASALSQDMGVTNLFFPDPICPPTPEPCGGDRNEAGGVRLMSLTLFTELLPPPDLSQHRNGKGEMLFMKIGCGGCHKPEIALRTGPERITAYSDLRRHRMGDGLDDGLPEGAAASDEWRTAPLWGLGAVLADDPRAPLLHDGRARGAEEAILWHGGAAARARHAFVNLSREDRGYLLEFLGGL